MNVSQLQRFQAGQLQTRPTDRLPDLPVPQDPDDADSSFKATLSDAIEEVDQAQKEADSQISAFVAGETDQVHEVMMSMEQANLSFQLMVEVRNRMLEAYQELMRLQV